MASAAAPSPGEDKKQAVTALPFGIFGSFEIKTNATAGLGEWQNLQAQMPSDEKLYKECDAGAASCPQYLREWRKNLQSWASATETKKLELVNAWVNHAIHYTEDIKAFGQKDFWASPRLSLRGRGDCEDYALAKYVSLKALGFSEDRLRIVVVNDTRKNIGHAILSVRTAEGVYILDNQNVRPVLQQQISYYAPVYSINANGRWINIATRQIKTQYAKAYENDGDPAMALRLAKLDVVAASETPQAGTPTLRPSFAETELRTTIINETAPSVWDEAEDRR